MSENLKRMLTMLLAASMIFSMMPLSVSAQDTAAEETLPEASQQAEALHEVTQPAEEQPEVTRPAEDPEKPQKKPVTHKNLAESDAVSLELNVQTDVEVTQMGVEAMASFTPEKTGIYILTSYADADTVCYLYDANGNYIYNNDDGGANYNFSLVYQLTAGETYYYGMRFYNDDLTGTIPVKLEKSAVQSVSVAPVTVIENTNGYWTEYWIDETAVEYFIYYPSNLLMTAEYVITLEDGTQITGTGNNFEYNGSWYSFETSYDQSYENRWLKGDSPTFTVSAMGCETEVSVTILPCPLASLTVEPVQVIENTNGYETTRWNEETQQYEPFYYYLTSSLMWKTQYTAVFTDGTVLTGCGYLEYEGVTYYFNNESGGQDNDPWTVGNTYAVRVGILGCYTELAITVVEMPLQSIQFDPITVREYTCGYTRQDALENGEISEYFYYDTYDLLQNATYTATLKDGTVITAPAYDQEQGSLGFMYDGVFYYFDRTTDQSYLNQWVSGNTYTITVEVMGVATEVSVYIEPEPLVSLTFTPVTVRENTCGTFVGDWNSETQQYNREYYQYNVYKVLEYSTLTATFIDGTVLTGSPLDESGNWGFAYNDEFYYFSIFSEQSYENQWLPGNTYNIDVKVGDLTAQVPVTVDPIPLQSLVFDPITVRENSHGWYNNDYNEATGQWDLQYWHYSAWEILNQATYTATFTDGTVVTGKAWNEELEIYGFEYDGERYEFTEYQHEQNYANQWLAGNTYEIVWKLMGKKAALPVIIEASPLVSLTFTPVTLTEGTGGWLGSFWNNETQKSDLDYFYYYTGNVVTRSTYTATFTDGTVLTGNCWNSEYGDYGFVYEGEFYRFEMYNDQSYDNQWLAGNTYPLRIVAMGKEASVDVTIAESPVVSITVDPVNIVEGQNCSQVTSYPGDADPVIWNRYYWNHKVSFTVTLTDGSQIQSTGGFYYGNEYFQFCTRDDQDYNNQWILGGTYEGAGYIGGHYLSVPVSIVESPVVSVTFAPIALEENTNGYWDWNSNNGEFYRYAYWYRNLSYTVTFRDGTMMSGTYYNGFYYDDVWYSVSGCSDSQSEQAWLPGNEYPVQVSINGKYYDATVSISSVEEADGYRYLVQGDTAIITECYLKSEILDIPATLNGYPVVGITGLGNSLNYATEIIIPDSVRMLSSDLFTYSNYVWNTLPLQKLVIGAGLSDISMDMVLWGSLALNLETVEVSENNPYICSVEGVVYDKDCTTMLLYPPAKKDLHTVPDTAANIDAVFELPGCHCISDFKIQFGSNVEGYQLVDGIIYDENMRTVVMATAEATGAYVMPESVRWMNDGAFAGSSLTSVTISPNVTGIAYNAFINCIALEEITIPESVKYIGYNAFDGCTGLKKVGISDLKAWCWIDMGSNPLYYAHDLYLNGEKIVDLVIPESVTESVYGYSINYNVFSGGSFVTVTMPENLQTIGYDAFANCENLEKVYISDLLGWSNNQFDNAKANPLYYAKNLYLNGEQVTDVVLSDIGLVSAYAFYNANIKSLTVAEAVYEIGYQSFCGSSVESISFEGPLVYIDSAAFRGSGLKSLTLPDTLYGMGESAFQSCASLVTLELGKGITELPWSCFRGTGITSVTLPQQITAVGSYAFAYSAVKELDIQCDMVRIGASAFEDCPLGDLHFGDNVEYIEDEAFMGSKATQITLPSSVTELSYRTFAFNSNLVSVTIPESITYIPSTAFEGDVNLSHVLYTGTEEQWYAAEFYSDELQSAAVHFGAMGNEVTTTQDCTTVTMFCSICNETQVFYKGSADHNLVNGVCTICGHEGDWGYRVEDGKAVIIGYYGSDTKVQMPSIIKGIPVKGFTANVFSYNENLKAVTLPSSITEIPDNAFYGCCRLTEVALSSATTAIGDRAFYGCNWLQTINLPDTITYIGEEAFYECWNIGKVVIPAGVTEIARAAFAECWNLTDLFIPSTVTTICYDAFAGCWQLSELNIPAGVQEIQGNAFGSCDLQTVRFYGDMPNIYYWAFENAAITMYYPASNSTWNDLDQEYNFWIGCYIPEIYVQPYAPAGQVGDTVTATVYADGVNLSYQWYIAAPGSAKFTLAAGEDGNTLSATLTKANSGTRAYCIVTDALGQTAKSEIATFKVETEATGIRLEKLPYTLEYDLWQALRLNGLEVVVVYDDQTEETLEEGMYEVSGYDPAKIGEQTVTVTYGAFSATFQVTVNAGKVNITDEEQGVEISAPGNVIDSDTKLVVEVMGQEQIPVLPELVQQYSSVIFDITLEKDGAAVQPAEAIEVSIPVPEYMQSVRCKVFYIDDNGNATDMNAKYENGYLVFTTSHFSYYAVVEVGGVSVSGSVTGTEPAGTVVKLISGNEVLATVSVNSDGSYRFDNITNNTYILEAFKDGLTPKQVEIVVEGQDLLVDILMAILGDVDGNTTVDTSDVVALLLYISMPDLFPVDADCDFDGNSQVTTDDAVKLLLHISMPDLFPL